VEQAGPVQSGTDAGLPLRYGIGMRRVIAAAAVVSVPANLHGCRTTCGVSSAETAGAWAECGASAVAVVSLDGALLRLVRSARSAATGSS
jgi:hypothetical protein